MYKLTDSPSIIVRIADGAHIPADPTNTDYQRYLEWLSEGNTPLPVDPPTPEQIVAQYTAVVQKRLDDFARTRGYDGILSACTYATSIVPKFEAEGQYAVEARDATWAKCYEVLAAVEAGSRPMPTLDELLAELPVLTWPN